MGKSEQEKQYYKKNDDTKINVPKIQTDIVGDSVVLEDATPVKTISKYKSIIQQLESELTTLKDKYIQKLEDNDKLHKENKELSNQLQHYHKSKFN